jgi:hypothetical protein
LDRETVGDVVTVVDLYRRIVDVPGEIFELGVRWGRRLALFLSLRELLEPYNYTRRVVGFDTFSGFPEVSEVDGRHPLLRKGGLGVPAGYVDHLADVLDTYEQDGPLKHVRRYEIRAGDVRETLPSYLADHPESVVSLAYFDLDLYEPTRGCLEILLTRMPKGGLLVFDQLTQVNFPGETAAVREVMGLSGVRFERLPYHPYPVFTVV